MPDGRPLQGRWGALAAADWARDSAALFAAFGGAGETALWRWTLVGPFADAGALRAAYESRHIPGEIFYTITRAADAAPSGLLAIINVRAAHGAAEIGSVVFGPALRRQRAATEALYLTLRHLFDDLGYRRVEWKCNSLNDASFKAAMRFGFVHEGRFRQHMVVKGENRDSEWFAMLDNDWPGIRAEYERWLDPANFSDDGRQKSPLMPPRRPRWRGHA